MYVTVEYDTLYINKGVTEDRTQDPCIVSRHSNAVTVCMTNFIFTKTRTEEPTQDPWYRKATHSHCNTIHSTFTSVRIEERTQYPWYRKAAH